MQITGKNHLSVDPATAWAAFHDAGVLERSIPGAQSLREIQPGTYAMTVTAGVAAIKGTYDGQAAFSQESEPESFVLSLSGAGGPGTVNADVHVVLSPADDGTAAASSRRTITSRTGRSPTLRTVPVTVTVGSLVVVTTSGVTRSMRTDSSSGSTRSRLAARPPPVTWDMACVSVRSARSRQALA